MKPGAVTGEERARLGPRFHHFLPPIPRVLFFLAGVVAPRISPQVWKMAIDTIRLRSPFIPESLARDVEHHCIERRATSLASGEVLYQITTGDLRGSWDSRIMVKVRREEWETKTTGKPRLVDCEPYIILECSAHKVMMGHNIYGGPTDFRKTCTEVIDLLEFLLGVQLPAAFTWIVQRVDWAEVYRLPFAAVQEFFEGIYTIQFPRRNKSASKHGSHSLHIPGTTTTVKLYHKGPEFDAHDSKRLKSFFAAYRAHTQRNEPQALINRWVNRKISALQRLANNRLRAEVGINSEKLDYDFGHRPQVHEVTDDYLKSVHDKEIMRLLKEGKTDMETVRKNKDVSRRLHQVYDSTIGNRLYGFWLQMATHSEEEVKRTMKRSLFYKYRKGLMDAGVSWLGTDVVIVANDSALPKDFRPLRTDPRVCYLPARNQPYLNDRDFLLKLAA
jgi:II/X family phage/plasmid replication protein